LENSLWHVQLDPATLAVRVTPANDATVQVSAGVAAHKVSHLIRRGDRIDWQWDDGAWTSARAWINMNCPSRSPRVNPRNWNFFVSPPA
jgi:hypothetical protein